MRAFEISLFVICINVGAVLVSPTGAFGTGPGSVGDTSTLLWVAIIGAVSAGGVSIIGITFKTPAIVLSFWAAYGASLAMLNILLWKIFSLVDAAVSVVFIGALDSLLLIVGVMASLQLAAGPMEGAV